MKKNKYLIFKKLIYQKIGILKKRRQKNDQSEAFVFLFSGWLNEDEDDAAFAQFVVEFLHCVFNFAGFR